MIAQRILYLRKEMNISQKELAKMLNVSPSAVGMYEQGKREPGIDMLIKLSKVFDISLDILLTGIESKAKNEKFKCPCIDCCWKIISHTDTH